ncbi:phosphotransferase [Colwelliaceae bacterium MEBiC 14330]
MSITGDLLNELKSLPCFTDIQSIELITEGLSQTAIKVTTTSQIFFAKKLKQATANTEIACALLCANLANKYHLEQGITEQLAPQVIYHDRKWLVTDFINGLPLADKNIGNHPKITIALKLMAKLHQLPITLASQPIPPLNPIATINDLVTQLPASLSSYGNILMIISKSLSTNIESIIAQTKTGNVICHGDINFSNILQDNCNRAWLIDFECAQLAPAEFELAMFIAVNNIAKQDITDLVAQYQTLVPTCKLKSSLLSHYVVYSFFINGLWYLSNIKPTANTEIENTEVENRMRGLAIEQWSAFDSFSIEYAMSLPRLTPIITEL